MTTLFISDLHLTATRPEITALFLNFLATEARATEALYILGDFFEYWIGDEAVSLNEHRPIIEALRAVTAGGTPVFFMHGNRDFLIAQRFERATGCQLIPDPTRIDIYGIPTLLMHGDTLCTDDIEYLAFRKMARGARWQREFLAKPIAERELIARGYREESRRSTSQKAMEIMDVTAHAVNAAMREHGVRHLIHGHTHRPAVHTFDLEGAPARRYVLGDWYTQGSVLRCEPSGWRLTPLPLPPSSAHSVS